MKDRRVPASQMHRYVVEHATAEAVVCMRNMLSTSPRPDYVYLESVCNCCFIVREAPFGMRGVGTGYNAGILQRRQAPHDGHPQLAARLGVVDAARRQRWDSCGTAVVMSLPAELLAQVPSVCKLKPHKLTVVDSTLEGTVVERERESEREREKVGGLFEHHTTYSKQASRAAPVNR